MSKKADLKTCRYAKCNHPNKIIDITKDDYTIIGARTYYHTDCLNEKRKEDWKDENTKNDLQYIKEQWGLHISKTVVYSQLMKCLNDLLKQGISSDYLVFVFEYIVKHKMNLRYPMGFKYYVDRQEIKDAYSRHQIAKSKTNQNAFKVCDSEDQPKFSVSHRNVGFGSILGGDRK